MNIPASDLEKCPSCGLVEAYQYEVRGWRYLYCDACGHEERLLKPKQMVISILYKGQQTEITGDRPAKPNCTEWRGI